MEEVRAITVHSQFHKTVQLGQLLDNNRAYPAKLKRKRMLEGVERCVIYIVKAGDRILYVGATNYSARDRLRWHIHGKSNLGRHIVANRPGSENWQVEMMRFPSRSALLIAEQRIIEELGPVLNE